MGKLIPLFLLSLVLIGCGKVKTSHLLENRIWVVQNITPPETMNFDIEAYNQAQDLKNGFYKNASFQFKKNGIFKATFNHIPDSGRFKVSWDGEIISLFPLTGGKSYEQIQIQQLNDSVLSFNTLIANFNMVINCKNK
ncbi:MAG: hypothetical protein ACYCOO_07350 [Chitinophagaceae bacterium]